MKEDSSWLRCSTGLAFGVVLGGSLTLAFAPALPVAVGVIATTTILWGAIGYLTEEYQKDNLKKGYNISSPSSSRRFSEEVGEDFATPPKSPKSSLKTVSELSVLETESILRSQRDEGEILQGPSPMARRVLFKSPSPYSRNDSVNVSKLTPYANPTTLESIIFDREESFPDSPQSTPQASPSKTRERRSASPSPSATPIYVSAHPTSITADLVIFSPLNLDSLATNEIKPPYCLDTPGRDLKSTLRIKAIKANAIDRRGECGEDPLSSMRLAGEQGCSKLVMAEWKKIDERLLDRPPLKPYTPTFYGYTRKANGL